MKGKFVVFAALLGYANLVRAETSGSPLKIGWIGAMTGPVSKYAAADAATLAMEEINRRGGINGRPLQIVFEDGKCQAKDAINAANALIEKEKLRFIVGGHCSTESLAIAPLVERSGALMLAASSSSPKLSSAGDHIFRMTAPNVRGIELLVPYILERRQERKVAIVYEETEYAQGMAEYFSGLFKEKSGLVPVMMAYKLGEGDFLPFATKIKSSGAEAIYLSVQSPDSAILFLRKARQLGLLLPVFGNEISGNAIQSAAAEDRSLFEGLVFAEPQLAADDQHSQDFIRDYKRRFKVDKLPNGFWSAEAYDAVEVIAEVLSRCGEEVEKVKQCLYGLTSYRGASGAVAFDKNGDGVRQYALKKIEQGSIRDLSPPA